MSASATGRFEQSFVFHMIRDFFLLLVAVAAVELAIRYVALLYDFRTAEAERVRSAAEQLANDVKSIMLNSGGPLAAQTVYPILDRNHDNLGLSIAVRPSDVTVESMKAMFRVTPQGLQRPWPEGAHQQAEVALKAEQFCLGCHVKAQVGDVLGTVAVRSYLARKEAVWWQEVRLTAGALSLKILAHTVVLLLLLKVRMEPMLSLRGTVGGLAKGVMDLGPRARVKTEDEFGQLAQDLNHFLDRIALVVRDLDTILSEVISVGERLGSVNRQLEQQVDGLRDGAMRTLADGAQRGLDTRIAVAHESGAFQALVQLVDAGGAATEALRLPLQQLQQRFDAVARALEAALPPVPEAAAQSLQFQALAQSLREMAVLEAQMQAVAESGQRVLQRLKGVPRRDT